MLKEGQYRNPSGCAVSAVIDRSGKPMSGRRMIDSIAVMHERSNGLGGGFAGYGIYNVQSSNLKRILKNVTVSVLMRG